MRTVRHSARSRVPTPPILHASTGWAKNGANAGTFRVLNANFEWSADKQRAYYRQTVIAGADPQTFPPDRAVTNCSDPSISFAD